MSPGPPLSFLCWPLQPWSCLFLLCRLWQCERTVVGLSFDARGQRIVSYTK
jgi:hypothetical protein